MSKCLPQHSVGNLIALFSVAGSWMRWGRIYSHRETDTCPSTSKSTKRMLSSLIRDRKRMSGEPIVGKALTRTTQETSQTGDMSDNAREHMELWPTTPTVWLLKTWTAFRVVCDAPKNNGCSLTLAALFKDTSSPQSNTLWRALYRKRSTQSGVTCPAVYQSQHFIRLHLITRVAFHWEGGRYTEDVMHEEVWLENNEFEELN